MIILVVLEFFGTSKSSFCENPKKKKKRIINNLTNFFVLKIIIRDLNKNFDLDLGC